MDLHTLFAVTTTTLSFIVFIGIILWAYSGHNKDRFDKLGHLPQDNEGIN